MSLSYKVHHTTRFAYPVPVQVCHNIVCLTPRPDPQLEVKGTTLSITPQPKSVTQRSDAFGNITHAFSIEEPHSELVVEAKTDVRISAPPTHQAPGPAWEQVVADLDSQSDPNWYDASPFRFGSSLVARDAAARDFASGVFTPGRPIDEAATALNALVHESFFYEPGATHVGTTSTEALHHRRGVCQDYAHAMIAALRTLGLPARYVSGYLRTIPPEGQPRLIGADQSHAWVGVYMGPSIGWVDLDPTNNMPTATDHIPLAIGRDYADIAPIRGAFLGGGNSRLDVSVDVEPIGNG